ncbi:hypothetical protein [Bacillus timonensis]|uniref:hypothetical protein n=1 Tax=Bacillus timonensis TaxID=1033734 RepID=UPI000289A90E|nr:hypothetical protein [Bacillus timonensis]
MKEKIFWVSLAVIVLSYIGNYLFFQSKQLDEPIFLEHYYELAINEQEEPMLTFYYVTNKSDTSTVNFVRINGIETLSVANDDFFMWNPQEPQYEQEFTHHYLKSVNVTFPAALEGDGPFIFSDMEVHFSDGQTVLADIGKVILLSSTDNHDVLETQISSSSNLHREEKSMVALQPITLENFEIPFEEDLSDDILIKVELDQEKLRELEKLKSGSNPPNWFDEDRDKEWEELPGDLVSDNLLPFSLEQNEWIRIMFQYNPTRFSYYQFNIKIIGKTKSGEEFVRKLPINDYPYLDQKAINRIIESKRGES